MTALSQELTKSCPGIAAAAVAGFRACLLAIANAMQAGSEDQDQSLLSWWQWLDEEGYERQALVEVLSQVGRATIGDGAFAELTAFSKSIENDRDGIVTLIDYVNRQHPDLAQEMEKIERLAQEEENQIQNMAGGMSKGAKDALIGLGSAAVVGLVGLGVKGIHSYWKRTKAEREPRLVEDLKAEVTNDERRTTVKIEDVAIDNARAREVASKAATKEDKNLANGIGLREQEQEAKEKLAQSVQTEKTGVEKRLRKEMTNTCAGIISKEDQEAINRIIDEKFMPSEKTIENYVRLDQKGIISRYEEVEFERLMIGHATKAELRKDRKQLGNMVDKELQKPELETVFSDSEIDSLYDLDRLVVNKLIGVDPEKIRKELAFWGNKESFFANGFDLRHPSVKIGLREYIREAAMNGMTTFNKEQALENLKKHEYGGLEGYLKTDAYEKMAKEAKREAIEQAIKKESFIREKTDYKQELKDYLNKDKANIEKEITENLNSEAQVIKKQEEKEAKNTLDAIEKGEKDSISEKIISETDDVIIETKQVARAAEEKTANKLDDF